MKHLSKVINCTSRDGTDVELAIAEAIKVAATLDATVNLDLNSIIVTIDANSSQQAVYREWESGTLAQVLAGGPFHGTFQLSLNIRVPESRPDFPGDFFTQALCVNMGWELPASDKEDLFGNLYGQE